MSIRNSLLFLFIFCFGCASQQPIVRGGATVIIPESPAPVVLDSGKYDKAKYPDTKWVKPPEVDLKKRIASWSFEDIEKISGALTEWPRWGGDVKEIIKGHNDLVTGKKDDTKRPWYRLWNN